MAGQNFGLQKRQYGISRRPLVGTYVHPTFVGICQTRIYRVSEYYFNLCGWVQPIMACFPLTEEAGAPELHLLRAAISQSSSKHFTTSS